MSRAFAAVAALVAAGCGSRCESPPAAGTRPAAGQAASAAATPAATLGGGRWIDLTHAFDADTIFWPTERGFTLVRGSDGPTAKGYFYAANRFETAEHGGTHLDAPRHFSATGQTADAVPPERFVGEAAVVDVTAECGADRDYEVTVDDLMDWEAAHGRPLADVIVLVRTGWAARWGDRERYLGTSRTGPEAVAELHFPGLAPEAAEWLARHRRVKAVGIDTASIDHGPSTHFGAHVALCGGNVPILENVAALDRLPTSGSFVAALPMKIAGGSGGPLRIVARLPDDVAAGLTDR